MGESYTFPYPKVQFSIELKRDKKRHYSTHSLPTWLYPSTPLPFFDQSFNTPMEKRTETTPPLEGRKHFETKEKNTQKRFSAPVHASMSQEKEFSSQGSRPFSNTSPFGPVGMFFNSLAAEVGFSSPLLHSCTQWQLPRGRPMSFSLQFFLLSVH